MRESVRMLVALLMLGASAGPLCFQVAHAQSPVDGAMTYEARLQQAVRYYQLSERDEARHVLAALVVDRDISLELRQQARVYLAEILLVDGNTEEARGFLGQVLQAEPDFIIDRFRHTPEVSGEFDYVKALLATPTPDRPPDGSELPPPQPIVLTMPLTVWSPFGRYHFANGRGGRGIVYFAGVTGSAVVSGFLGGLLLADHGYKPDEEAALRSRRRAQWISTGMFYGVWGASVIDAQIHWRKNSVNVRVEPSLGFAPTSIGPTPALQVAGSF